MIKRLAIVLFLFPLLAQGCATGKKEPPLTSSSSIESQIKNRLKSDPLTAPWQIQPRVEKTTVILTGLVDKDEERRRAEDLTRTVVGELRKIDNEILLTHEVILDNSIVAKLKNELISDPITRDAGINVQSQKGVVILTGKVQTDEQKRQAETLAKNISGVSHVENQLKVKG
jgi:hyperosmotically inducible protein